MGSGKSSVGKELSALLSYSYIDLDEYIEKKEGRSIWSIFNTDGEAGFRSLEYSALVEVLERDVHIVLSLGGGTLLSEEISKYVKSKGRCIYLKARSDTLAQRLIKDANSRPLLKDSAHSFKKLTQRLEKLSKEREVLYEKTAHYIVDVDGKSIGQICEEISSLKGKIRL